MGNAKSTTEKSASTTVPTSVTVPNPTTSVSVTAANKTAPTSAITRVCCLCGLEVPKHLLSQHNKEVHKVLRFEWVNGVPNMISKPVAQSSFPNEQTVEHSMANVQLLPVTHIPMFPVSAPPIPNSPAPIPIIPKPPSEPQSPDSIKNTLNNAVKSAKVKMVPINHLEDTNAYDMDISAESDTDSDHFVEGNLFDTSKDQHSAAQSAPAEENVAEISDKTKGDILLKNASKKSRFSDDHPTVAENMRATQSTNPTCKIYRIAEIPKYGAKKEDKTKEVKESEKTKEVKNIKEAKETKKDVQARGTTKSSRPKLAHKHERPKLNSEVNENFFELILTARVFSDSDAEYAEFPVQSNLKHKDTEATERPQKRQRRTSSSSTVSSNGKTQQLRVTNADLKKIIDSKLGQDAPKKG